MPEMPSLTKLTVSAFRVACRNHFLWWLALPISALMGISSFAAGELQQLISDSPGPSSLLALTKNLAFFNYFGLLLLAFFFQVTIRGPLILWLNNESKGTVPSPTQKKLGFKDIVRATRVSLLFEASFWLILFMVAVVLSIPGLASWFFNPLVFSQIYEIGSFILIVLGIYLYFMKELAYLYTLLGNVSVSSAVHLGFRLYRKQTLSIIFFFLYDTLLLLFFTLFTTYCLSLIGLDISTKNISNSLLFSLPIGFYFVFDQSLRLSFFRSIATAPKRTVPSIEVLAPNESKSGVI